MGFLARNIRKRKQRGKRDELRLLRKKKAEFEQKLGHGEFTEQEADELKLVNCEIEKYAKESAAASIFRSRCCFAQGGEKCSAFFLSLEKKKYLEKNMKCVITDKGQKSTKQKTILEEQTKFYNTLYTSNPEIKFQLIPEHGERVLTTEENEVYEKSFHKTSFMTR